MHTTKYNLLPCEMLKETLHFVFKVVYLSAVVSEL
jgi:hypothetical protein